MPDVVIGGNGGSIGAGDKEPEQRPDGEDALLYRVELREHWADEWEWAVDLWPVGLERNCIAVGGDRLTLEYRYGPQERRGFDLTPTRLVKFYNLVGWWVRVVARIGDADVTLFQGRVGAPVEDPEGDQTAAASGGVVEQGVQRWIAYGPLELLRRITFARSWWSTEEEEVPIELGWMPDWNLGSGDPTFKGNRSEALHYDETNWTDAAYVFGGTDDWDSGNILQYLMQWVHTALGVDGPRFTVGGDDWYLYDIYPRLQSGEVENAAALLQALLHPSRGLSATFDPVDTGWDIYVFGLSALELSFDGKPNLQNEAIVPLDVSAERTHSVRIERANQEKYSKLRVVGDRVRSVFSLGPASVADLAGTLVPTWTSTDEGVYKNPSTSEDPRVADELRASPRFERVFQALALDRAAFDYKAGAANPVFAADGTYAGSDTLFQLFQMATLPQLPLKAGVTYTTDPPGDQTQPGTPAYWLPPLVWAYDETTGRYFLLNRAGAFDPAVPSAEVKPLERDLGVFVRTNPNHVLARGHWTSADPSLYNPDALGVDYEKLVCTVCVETDNRISIEIELPPELRDDDGSVKEVVAALAQFWWLTGDTIVGTDASGAFVRAPSDGVALRNDIELLKVWAPNALAQLAFERTRGTITRTGALEDWGVLIGTVLRLEGDSGLIQELYTPVTSAKWDFPQRVTSLYCGLAERG